MAGYRLEIPTQKKISKHTYIHPGHGSAPGKTSVLAAGFSSPHPPVHPSCMGEEHVKGR
jgi:hypothetical protein